MISDDELAARYWAEHEQRLIRNAIAESHPFAGGLPTLVQWPPSALSPAGPGTGTAPTSGAVGESAEGGRSTSAE